MLSNEDLAQKLLIFRGTYGMTQEMFSNLCGISKTTLNTIETGKRKANAMTRVKIIKFMEEYENDLETNNEEN